MDGYLTHNHPESDERQRQLSTSSASGIEVHLGLAPATPEDFRVELTSCLALCAPTGMTQDDRKEWLRVAWGTLQHLPPDLLKHACKVARAEADHPSKIVPIITRETADSLSMRRQTARYCRPDPEAPRLERPDYCTPTEASTILRQYGLRSSFDRDPA